MNNSPLVEIDAQRYQVQIDLIYAGADNLAGRVIYPNARCLLHRQAADCLYKASQLARQAGFTLRIYDAYRPPYAQYLLWDALPNNDYVRDPHLGSHHSRGVAVDLTERERQVLQLIAEGNGNRQTGEKLGISIKTVEKHRQSVMNKLHIHEAAGLTLYAIAKGMVPCARPSLVPAEVATDALNIATASPAS